MVFRLKYWRKTRRTPIVKARTITLSETQTARNKAVLLFHSNNQALNGALFLCPKNGKSIAGGRAARLFPEKRETGCGAEAIAAACRIRRSRIRRADQFRRN